MATPRSPGPHVTAALAGLAAVGLAALPVGGPWQPASVILAWSAVALVGTSLLTGHTWGLGAGAAIFVIRTGVHGLAGTGIMDLVVSAGLLVLLVEMGATSFEARRVPVDWPDAVARAVTIAVGAAAVVGLLAALLGGWALQGAGAQIGGLAAALGLVAVVVWLHRGSGTTA